MVVRTNVEGDVAEGIDRILVASRHAYVFLESADVGDRLFQRLRDGDPALEQKVFICRGKDYLPAPGLLSEEQIIEDRAAEKGMIGLAENEERREVKFIEIQTGRGTLKGLNRQSERWQGPNPDKPALSLGGCRRGTESGQSPARGLDRRSADKSGPLRILVWRDDLQCV
jgi:hypothetical protein